jgi:hypothetical protein
MHALGAIRRPCKLPIGDGLRCNANQHGSSHLPHEAATHYHEPSCATRRATSAARDIQRKAQGEPRLLAQANSKVSIGIPANVRRINAPSMQMKLPSKRSLLLSMFTPPLGGVALAAYELNNLHRGIKVAHEIGASVAKGLGGSETIFEPITTVSVSLCFGLIPLGPVGDPYLVIAVGDFLLGTLITGFAILVGYTLRQALSRNAPMGNSHRESSNA